MGREVNVPFPPTPPPPLEGDAERDKCALVERVVEGEGREEVDGEEEGVARLKGTVGVDPKTNEGEGRRGEEEALLLPPTPPSPPEDTEKEGEEEGTLVKLPPPNPLLPPPPGLAVVPLTAHPVGVGAKGVAVERKAGESVEKEEGVG